MDNPIQILAAGIALSGLIALLVGVALMWQAGRTFDAATAMRTEASVLVAELGLVPREVERVIR